MQNIEKITSEIIERATQDAKRAVEQAELKRSQLINSLESELDMQRRTAKAENERMAEEIVRRRLTLAGPHARMSALSAKRKLIDEAYDRAIAIVKKDKDAYKKLFSRLLSQCGENGSLIVATADKALFDQAWLDKVCVECGKKITLSKQHSDATGGMVLSTDEADIDLTLDTLISDVRAESERDVAKMLFGE